MLPIYVMAAWLGAASLGGAVPTADVQEQNAIFQRYWGTDFVCKLSLAYAKESQGEYQQSPRLNKTKTFHYRLDLNANGEIVGGDYYGDSARIDMLWVPVRPKPSKQPGNERGNPYVNVDTILAIWRDSVPEETRQRWLIADPAAEDRVADTAFAKALVPVQQPAADPAVRPAEAVTATPRGGDAAVASRAAESAASPSNAPLPGEVSARAAGR